MAITSVLTSLNSDLEENILFLQACMRKEVFFSSNMHTFSRAELAELQTVRRSRLWSGLFSLLNFCHMVSAKGHGQHHCTYSHSYTCEMKDRQSDRRETSSLRTYRKMTHTERRETEHLTWYITHAPSENPAANK